MTFLQPYWLWGMLAVAVPVAIHFWYQKKGKTIDWAAMRWLGEPATLPHRGLRLNEIALMLLRCALLALLALILSKPVVPWLSQTGRKKVVHLVQPHPLVTETWRFELSNALKSGEEVYWLGASPEKATDLASMPEKAGEWTQIQTGMNALAAQNASDFKLYFAHHLLPESPARMYIPGAFELFPAADSAGKDLNLFKNKPVFKNTIHVLLDYANADERKTVAAALAALQEIHGFPFETATKAAPGKHYDYVFTNKPVTKADAGTRYIVSGAAPDWNAPASVISFPESLRLPGSELVESGRLPEWLGNWLVQDLKLDSRNKIWGKSQLNALFEKTSDRHAQEESLLRRWLLLALIGLLIAERWLALRKTGASYG